jgi:pilus assembly protein CpaD
VISGADVSNRTTSFHIAPLPALARLAGVAALAALLGACANVHHIEVGAVPDDYRTNHPIIVSERETTMDVPVATGDRHLTMAARGAVRGYAQRYKARASGSVQIIVPHGSMNAGAASIVASDIRKELVKEGVPDNRIITAGYQAGYKGDAAPIRLSYFGIDASTGECGRWPEDILANGAENKHYANFGCATQNNLAAQIADPMDLIAPRGMTPIDAGRREQVLRDYQSEGAGL